jgi:endogenous inhibitor of DNA gyrase (YacG/DUF329 family)
MINKCKICGKEFEAQQRNHNLCSDECRKISLAERRKAYLECHGEEQRRRSREYQRQKSKPIYCKICGKEVEPHYTPMGYRSRYRYHRDCLVDEAIAAIVRGEKYNGEKNILTVASNKGFQKADLLEIMAERGIKYGKQKPIAVWRG